MRTSSFDPEEARRAWRQVARMRGRSLGGGRNGDAPRVSAKRIAAGVIVAVLVVLGAAELAGDDDEDSSGSETVVVASSPTAVGDTGAREPAAGGAPQWATKLDGGRLDDGSRQRDTSASAAADTVAPPRTSTPRIAIERRPSVRVIPHGTGSLTAKAFSRIPVSRYDRAPVGAIAPTGLHVDRIAVGNGYVDNRCQGNTDGFAVGRDEEIHVCMRVVHLRQHERLVVRWEKDGRVVRRTRLAIPPHHAYRTRAGLRLREGYEGRWRVRIVTPHSGRELATASFTVDA